MSFSHCLALLEQLSQVFDQLETLEREKAAAVGAQDLERLDQCMKQEQAVSLTLRGVEQNRASLWKELCVQAVPLRELPGHFPPEERPEARRVVNRLLEQYQTLRSAQEPTRILMEHRIHLIEEELERRGVDPSADQPPAGPPRRGPTHTDMKV